MRRFGGILEFPEALSFQLTRALARHLEVFLDDGPRVFGDADGSRQRSSCEHLRVEGHSTQRIQSGVTQRSGCDTRPTPSLQSIPRKESFRRSGDWLSKTAQRDPGIQELEYLK